MTVSELMQAMANAGAPMEAIIIAVRAIEQERDVVAAKRAVERDRKRRQRAKVGGEDGTVTGQSRDTDGTVTDTPSPQSPPLKVSPNPFKESPPLTPQPVEDLAPARSPNPFPRPDFADPDHWRDFLANRKRKSRANTATAHKRLMDDIARYSDDEWPPGRLIEHAAAEGWAGIYDPRKGGKSNGNSSRYTGPKSNPQSPADAIFAARRNLGIDGGDMGFDAGSG